MTTLTCLPAELVFNVLAFLDHEPRSMMKLSLTCKNLREAVYQYLCLFVFKPFYMDKLLEIYSLVGHLESTNPNTRDDHSYRITKTSLRRKDCRINRTYALWFLNTAVLSKPPSRQTDERFWLEIARSEPTDRPRINALIEFIRSTEESTRDSRKRVLSIILMLMYYSPYMHHSMSIEDVTEIAREVFKEHSSKDENIYYEGEDPTYKTMGYFFPQLSHYELHTSKTARIKRIRR